MKKTVFVIILIVCIGFVPAQNFSNRQLEYFSQLMNCTIPHSSTTFNCSQVSTQLPLIAEYNELKQLCHLGVSLFTPDIKELAGKPVCNFLERLMLELFLQKTDVEMKKLLEEYKIALHFPLRNSTFRNSLEYAITHTLKEASEYMITKDSLTWNCSWKNENERFSVNFPANYDLILGLDKKEAEEQITQQIRNFNCKNRSLIPMTIDVESLQPLNGKIYVLPGARLFIKNMNTNLYFIKNEIDEYNLIFDRNFPEESISNLFMHPDKKSAGIKIHITQRVYGNQTNQYELDLYDFLCFWKDDYDIYAGIEKCTAQEIEMTVIFRSKYFNCFQMLYVQAAPQDFFDKKGTLKTTFYTYIPNHNIKNLYKQIIESKSIKLD